MPVDGRIDDTSPERLVLSGPADLARVDGLRASCDAIVVGANTLRRDKPPLLVRAPALQAAGLAPGGSAHPVRVTLTGRGDLDPAARFFAATPGAARPLVYCARPPVRAASARLGTLADVIDAGDPASVRFMLADLVRKGCQRVLVEGGATLLRPVLIEDL